MTAKIFSIRLLTVNIVFSCATWLAMPSAAYGAAATVEFCHDGDTCRLKFDNGMSMNVRLDGIDAPEVVSKYKKIGQPYGNQSRDYLNDLVRGKRVDCVQRDLDRYNRPVVELIVGNVNVNLKLVELGLAEVYAGSRQHKAYASHVAAESAAKQKRIGIWQQRNYQSPSQFRQATKAWRSRSS